VGFDSWRAAIGAILLLGSPALAAPPAVSERYPAASGFETIETSVPVRYESQKELTMAMKVLADIRDREWDLYSRQLDAWRTQQLIEADRQRDAALARKLARDVEEMQAALGETKAALSERDAALGETKAALGETKAALGETKAALGETKAALAEADTRARAAEAALAKLLSDLGKK
jgi:chromosome segregation ATPase